VLLGPDALRAWFEALCMRWNRIDPADPCGDWSLCAAAAMDGKPRYGWSVSSWP
jgi:hypothetical protein